MCNDSSLTLSSNITLYTQKFVKSCNISKIIEKYVKQIILLKLINCGVQS